MEKLESLLFAFAGALLGVAVFNIYGLVATYRTGYTDGVRYMVATTNKKIQSLLPGECLESIDLYNENDLYFINIAWRDL